MAEKHSHLNGAYYGPAIPPARSYHRHGHGSGCGCCCLLSFLIKLIVTAVVILGLAALIFWLIFRPNIVKFHVTDASLTQFNLTSDNNLHYNLALNITVRNPNKKIGIYYDRIEANAGGVRASRFAANFGASVAVCELPFWIISSETTGGVGGT
ncbi:hypothetical protein SLEP1_g57299 [Rubroshorea leprosula]|uniref:Late embryogenesis abundant protein LEA-2 subgroup domain-containing protein n=1 Tax=Rubroshorea leprosula TaxID=152421 RepID=A0AAV5MKY7_9ROSI|nr:hypothetical protein SLEP1_g57299 [Rubroshorea leprosula]